MEKKMMMPANYNVMTEEEMTYTEGGYGLGLSLVASVLYTGVSIYNEIWAAKNIKNFVNSHKGQDTSVTINAAVDQFKNYINKDVKSAVIGVYSVWNQLTWWPITGIYCLLA